MRLILPILVLVALLLASVAWDRPQERADLTLGYTSIETLDAQVARASEDIRVAYALFEGLCTFDPHEFAIMPGVAESWDISDDQRSYTFHLRSDARWSDGSPVTAHDFRFAWKLGLMPDTAPPYIEFLFFIKGGEDYFDWCQATLRDIQSVETELDALANEIERAAGSSETPDLTEEEEGEREKQWERLQERLSDEWVEGIRSIRSSPLRSQAQIDQAGRTWLRLSNQLPRQQREMAQRRVQKAEEKFDELVGVEVLDDHTLTVELEAPTPYFLEIAATWPLFPLHRETLEANTRLDPHTHRLRRDPQWTKPKTIVSNGPYTLEQWDFKRRVRLQASPDYWDAENVGPGSVELINFQDLSTMFTAYESGKLDLMLGAGPLDFAADLIEADRSGRRDDVHDFDAYGTYYYVFNTRDTRPDGSPNPLADPRVRKALAMSINKPPLVERVTRLRQTVTNTFIPADAIDGYEAPAGLPYDPDAARELMEEAGYPGGAGFPPFVLLYNTSGGHENVAQAVARMWNRELGVRIQLEGQEWKVFLRRRNEGDFDAARSGWFGDYLDPTTFLDLFKTGNGNNDAGFSDPRYDELLREAAAEPDPAKRMDRLQEAEAYVMEQGVPAIPLYYYKMMHLYDEEQLQGVSTHPRNLQMFHRMKIKDDS